MSAVPARRDAATSGWLIGEGTDDEIRAVLRQTGGKALRGQKLPDGRKRVQIALPADGVKARWWQGRSWKFWTPIASGGVLALGGCLVAAVVVLKAIIAAVVVIATMALGAVIVIGGIAVAAAVRGGGTWTGSGTWR